MKKLFLMIFLLSSCSFFESDYDKIMNPIKKIKLAEKKAGKANPVFDGVIEPDFPYVKENNKTLEGVDSNHDGVRDDIEIWINRTAEDESIRQARKDLYKKYVSMLSSILENEPEAITHEKNEKVLEVQGCLATLYYPYKAKYLKQNEKDGVLVNSDQFEIVLSDSKLRSKIFTNFNFYEFKGSFGGRPDIYCTNQSYVEIYRQRLNLAIKENLEKRNKRKK